MGCARRWLTSTPGIRSRAAHLSLRSCRKAALRLRRSALLLAAPLLLAAGCGSSSSDTPSSSPSALTLAKSDLGDQWPLTVSPVTLHCEVDGTYKYVTFDYDGTTYALNGSARQVVDDHGWKDFQPKLWADNPESGGKVVANDLITRGLTLSPA